MINFANTALQSDITDSETPQKIMNIKAITMVRNDRFLEKWVDYYGSQLGKENREVFFDGEDQQIPDFCNGVISTLDPNDSAQDSSLKKPPLCLPKAPQW